MDLLKKTMTEQQIQKKISKRYEELGYYVIKLINTNKNGIPDLICIKPDDVVFVEVKRPGGKTSKLQDYRIKELRNLGFEALILDK